MINVIRAFFIFSSLLFIYPLAGESNEKTSSKIEHPKTVLDEVLENPSLSTLAKIIVKTNIVDILESQGPFTLFAPSNEAFAKLSPGTLEDWLKPSNKEKLTAILKFHIVLGKMTLEELKKNKGLMTLEGQHVSIKFDNNKVTINNAAVVRSNLEYPNGIVYIIDQILIPK
jgi:uncharacterized surface protein with fasciclin (FAS1) repeats